MRCSSRDSIAVVRCFRAQRGCTVLNSPSQTGKAPSLDTDAGRIGLIIHWALKSKKVPTSEARLYGFELDLALEGKVSAEPTDELYFGQTLVWLYGFLHSLPQIFIVSLSHFPT